MQNFKKNLPILKSVAFIDYKPAELVIKTQWLVVFYAKNPISKKLNRFRVCVPAMKNKPERIKAGKSICLKINAKLSSGWLPWHDSTESRNFKSFGMCAAKFLDATTKDVQNGTKRLDTERSYRSGISMLTKYVDLYDDQNKLLIEIDKAYLTNYMDWVFYTNKVSSRTYNNYLGFLSTFFTYCVDRGYCRINPVLGLKKKPKQAKIRQVLSFVDKTKLKTFCKTNEPFYAICMMQYYCFIRPTEITKLKIGDIDLKTSTITVNALNSKNKKTEVVTIPEAYTEIIKNHIGNYSKDHFVFGNYCFLPELKSTKPKKISDTWQKFKKEYNIAKNIHFYSLKDTGITDLITTGIPSVKVKNQARHSDLKMTETYIYNPNNCDAILKNIDFEF